MKIECPNCLARYRIDTSGMQKKNARARCPRCGQVFSFAVADSGRKKILVVDDSRFFREMIVDVLKSLPHLFLTAGDGLEAREVIRRERPELVIVDLNLPGLSGLDLIRELRADPELGQLRLLAMSGVYRREVDALEAERAGANEFIGKSFKPEQLLDRVRRLLENAAGPDAE